LCRQLLDLSFQSYDGPVVHFSSNSCTADTGSSDLLDSIAATEGHRAIRGHDYRQGISGKRCIRCNTTKAS
jgi:hypothetical protein